MENSMVLAVDVAITMAKLTRKIQSEKIDDMKVRGVITEEQASLEVKRIDDECDFEIENSRRNLSGNFEVK